MEAATWIPYTQANLAKTRLVIPVGFEYDIPEGQDSSSNSERCYVAYAYSNHRSIPKDPLPRLRHAFGRRMRRTEPLRAHASRCDTGVTPTGYALGHVLSIVFWEGLMRVARTALALAVLGSVLFGGSGALASTASSSPAGGAVGVVVAPGQGASAKIVVYGAIGGYGEALTIDKSGKTDTNGSYVKVTLQQGTFEINAVALNAKFSKVAPTIYSATCSAHFSDTDPVSLFDGTGLYKGISGTINVTIAYALIGPRYTTGTRKGQCNLGASSEPLAQIGSYTGTGRVQFS